MQQRASRSPQTLKRAYSPQRDLSAALSLLTVGQTVVFQKTWHGLLVAISDREMGTNDVADSGTGAQGRAAGAGD